MYDLLPNPTRVPVTVAARALGNPSESTNVDGGQDDFFFVSSPNQEPMTAIADTAETREPVVDLYSYKRYPRRSLTALV